MSKYIFERCLEEQPHKQHEWRPGFLWRRRWCLGRELIPWLKANPSIENQTIILPKGLEIPAPKPEPEPHKHSMRLSGWSGTAGKSIGHQDTVLKFTCRYGCKNPKGYPWFISIPRWQYNDMVLDRTGINQTWPQ